MSKRSFLQTQTVSNGFSCLVNDMGSGADQNLTVFLPPTPDPGYYQLGHVAVQGYTSQPSHPVIFVKPENDDAGNPCLAAPVDFQQVWADHGSGADSDFAFWIPIAPNGYVAIGHIARNNYSKPSVSEYPYLRCVRRDLADQVQAVDPAIWGDWGSGADRDISLWGTKDANNFTSGYFIATSSYQKPNGPLFDLKKM